MERNSNKARWMISSKFQASNGSFTIHVKPPNYMAKWFTGTSQHGNNLNNQGDLCILKQSIQNVHLCVGSVGCLIFAFMDLWIWMSHLQSGPGIFEVCSACPVMVIFLGKCKLVHRFIDSGVCFRTRKWQIAMASAQSIAFVVFILMPRSEYARRLPRNHFLKLPLIDLELPDHRKIKQALPVYQVNGV